MSAADRFYIQVPEEVLLDLKARLELTRWPDEVDSSAWVYGTNLSYAKELCEYWRTKFDWRAQEEKLNAFEHYRTTIDGTGIHYLLAKGKGPNPIPLLLTHGWPSSFTEMLKVIPLLTEGEICFDVVVPSLPSYTFSDRPSKPGVSVYTAADLFYRLMTEHLGYEKFAAQGGDWGAYLTARLAAKYPERLHGIHLSFIPGNLKPDVGPSAEPMSDEEWAYLEKSQYWTRYEGGYEHIQSTKPQSLAYGLNDSPAGLASWIVEKFRAWSDCHGNVESRFSKDELLTNITLYWVTQTIGSSMRLYFETMQAPWELVDGERIQTPTAVAIFPKDLNVPPRRWGERMFNVQQWTQMRSGGHFAAAEEPELFADDIRAFFKSLGIGKSS